MMTLYDFMGSGNGYKVRLVLSHLGLPYKLVERDILKGETRTPEFLTKNPNGRIPTLQLDDGSHLFESNAIVWYLAEGTKLAPADRRARAETLQWMFFEQYSHEPYVAVPRFWLTKGIEVDPETLAERQRVGYLAFDAMEPHLAGHDYLAAERYTLADIALYAYTHVAHEGGFDLSGYRAIGAWLERVASEPGHVPIDA